MKINLLCKEGLSAVHQTYEPGRSGKKKVSRKLENSFGTNGLIKKVCMVAYQVHDSLWGWLISEHVGSFWMVRSLDDAFQTRWRGAVCLESKASPVREPQVSVEIWNMILGAQAACNVYM